MIHLKSQALVAWLFLEKENPAIGVILLTEYHANSIRLRELLGE